MVHKHAPLGAHISRMTFNAPLIRDVELIEAMREASASSWLTPKGPAQSVIKHRFHMIDAGPYTGELSDDSKMKPEAELLTYLSTAGRTEAESWLNAHGKSVGKNATVDLAEQILGAKSRLPTKLGKAVTLEPIRLKLKHSHSSSAMPRLANAKSS